VNRALDVLPPAVVRPVVHRLWPLQEPELRRLDDYLPTGRTAVDIGTWWGPWTAAMAKRCPQVHSFEPQPQLAAQLRTWVPSHVTVHEAGVSDSSGSATLTRPDDLPGTDGLATLRPDAEGEQIGVAIKAIDDCDFDNVGFMKIDVEGLELAALTGASETIDRDHPRLMIEIEQRHLDYPIDRVFEWLTERGYDGWFLRNAKSAWYPLEDFDVHRDQLATVDKPKSVDYVNAFLFVHQSEGWGPNEAR
jgi:FkbM family methyltransferase